MIRLFAGRTAGDRRVLYPWNGRRKRKIRHCLFNLAELQNECSKRFKISPDETLRIVQELYEKKLVTYPRTDASVLVHGSCKRNLHKKSAD